MSLTAKPLCGFLLNSRSRWRLRPHSTSVHTLAPYNIKLVWNNLDYLKETHITQLETMWLNAQTHMYASILGTDSAGTSHVSFTYYHGMSSYPPKHADRQAWERCNLSGHWLQICLTVSLCGGVMTFLYRLISRYLSCSGNELWRWSGWKHSSGENMKYYKKDTS